VSVQLFAVHSMVPPAYVAEFPVNTQALRVLDAAAPPDEPAEFPASTQRSSKHSSTPPPLQEAVLLVTTHALNWLL